MKQKILFSVFLLILFTTPYVANEMKGVMKPKEICIEGLAYAVISNTNDIAMTQVFLKHPTNTPKLCDELLEKEKEKDKKEKERREDEGLYGFLTFFTLILMGLVAFFAYSFGVKKKTEDNS